MSRRVVLATFSCNGIKSTLNRETKQDNKKENVLEEESCCKEVCTVGWGGVGGASKPSTGK